MDDKLVQLVALMATLPHYRSFFEQVHATVRAFDALTPEEQARAKELAFTTTMSLDEAIAYVRRLDGI